MFDLAIHSNSVVTAAGIANATVVVKNGFIVDVLPGFLENAVDVGDKVLMPGIIDPHVHINEPGRTEWEGFDTATRAAIAGGVTTLIDMPLNSSPVTTTTEAFGEKIAAAKRQLHADCGFWGGIIPGNQNQIEPLVEKGTFGFKAFLTHSGIDEFPNVTEADLREAMPIIAKHGLPLLVHCELPNNHEQAINFDSHQHGRRSYQDYLDSRPKSWEDNAIALMIQLCEEFACRVHIVHLSSANSIEQIRRAKEKGLPLTVETCQHYLYFTSEQIPNGATQFKCAPPIREKGNNEKLWQALKEGIIDFVATDHSPCPPGMKKLERGDFMNAWGGIASIQFSLPALWTAARKHDCSVVDIAKWLCEMPAGLPGLQTKKARIEKGLHADMVVWDPEKKFVVNENTIYHKHKLTPYLNEELYGVVEQTWLAGKKVYDSGKFIDLNQGKILTAPTVDSDRNDN